MKKYVLAIILTILAGGYWSGPVQAQVRDGGRTEWPLKDLKPVEGRVYNYQNATIGGRVFSTAIAQDVSKRVSSRGDVVRKTVFANPGEYGRFEAWIGVRGGTRTGRHQFIVQGDGETLFTSKWMELGDTPYKLSISVKGYSGITLTAVGNDVKGGDSALWANAVFMKATSAVPQLLSPQPNARLSRNTQLVWEEVDSAAGYLLELQAVALGNSRDAHNRNRFITVQYPVEVTTHLFSINEMPRGKWRWRVHALSATGFLGEMTEWRYFTWQ